MTVTSAISTVADSIATLSISGVTIKDIDQIPDSAATLCPLLIPQPNDFVSGINVEFVSYGSNGTAKINMEYTLTYVYLHAQAGSGVNTYSVYSGLITKLSAIIVAILSNDAITGAVDIALQSVSNIGIINDPTNNEFWGVIFSFKVLEYSQ
jgi:hypothetical protein